MKKIAAISLAAICLLGSGCSFLEEGSSGGHIHKYKEISTTATCVLDGVSLMRCACGAEEIVGTPALGHDYAENATSPSRLRPCKREGCDFGALAKADGADLSQNQSTFTQADKEKMDGQYAELLQKIEAAGSYQANVHAYLEGSALDEEYKQMETLFKAYKNAVTQVGKQYQYAQIQYHVHMDAKRKAHYMQTYEYYHTSYGYFSGLYQKLYDSAYREYFYHGKTEQQIQEILQERNVYSDQEIIDLDNENEGYSVLLAENANAATDPLVLDWYEAFVANNNRIAELKGYANYMEYAYEDVYAREYTYAQADDFYDYVKTYLAPVFLAYNELQTELFAKEYTEQEFFEFNTIYNASFFESVFSNAKVNDFLALLSMEKKDEGTHSFLQSLENLIEKGNFFLGQYEGAYSWRIDANKTPIVYFGEGYREAFTFVHEFGHYTNYLCNASYVSKQSYDLAETHSQGMEMLFLRYLKENMSKKAYELLLTTTVRYNLGTILCSVSVNKFEQAVYTGEYDGKNSEIFLADGKITKDEYDALYQSILEDLGVGENLNASYWRHVTIPSPGYYISYAISMVSSMQLLSKTEGFQSAVESYVKTLTYTYQNGDWNYKQVLTGADLYAYDNEQLFIDLREYLLPTEGVF